MTPLAKDELTGPPGEGYRRMIEASTARRYTRIDGDINGQGLAALAPDGRTALRFQYHEISQWNEYQTDTFAATSIRTGRINHQLVVGVEAGLSTADSDIGIGPASPLDIFNPVYPPAPEPVARTMRYATSRLRTCRRRSGLDAPTPTPPTQRDGASAEKRARKGQRALIPDSTRTKVVECPQKNGSSAWIRTRNPPVNSRMLYR